MKYCSCCCKSLDRGVVVQDKEEGELSFCTITCWWEYYGIKYKIPRKKDLLKNPKEIPYLLLTSTGEKYYNIEEVAKEYSLCYEEF